MKNTLITILALALTLSLLALPALADDAVEEGRIKVSSSGTLTLKADYAIIEIGASSRARTVNEAHKASMDIMDQIIAELAKLGIVREDVKTSQYNIYFEQDYSASSTSLKPVGFYNVTNMLLIHVRDISKVSQVIDTATSAGANNMYSLSFRSSREDEAYLEALAKAVENAKVKAQVLAVAAGGSLGQVLSIESHDYQSGMPYMNFSAKDAYTGGEAASTPILSGDILITANVILEFKLK